MDFEVALPVLVLDVSIAVSLVIELELAFDHRIRHHLRLLDLLGAVADHGVASIVALRAFLRAAGSP
jgi:hypothetical protein